MTPDLDALKAHLKAMTKGPYDTRGEVVCGGGGVVIARCDPTLTYAVSERDRANAKAIADTLNAAPDLIAEIERLRGLWSGLREWVADHHDVWDGTGGPAANDYLRVTAHMDDLEVGR